MDQTPHGNLGKIAPKDRNLEKQSVSDGYPSQTLYRWGTSWLKVGTDIIQGDLTVQLVWMEKRAHNGYLKRTVVEDVDTHGYVCRHHRGIQHRVEAPMPYGELTENHHRA